METTRDRRTLVTAEDSAKELERRCAKWRAVRSRCSADLDVWAAVEICRAIDASESPVRDDAVGKWEEFDELVDEFIVAYSTLQLTAEKKVRKRNPLRRLTPAQERERLLEMRAVYDARLRMAMIDVLFKFLTQDARRFGQLAGRINRTVKPAITSDGAYSSEIETWAIVGSALWTYGPEDAWTSAIRVRPRKGRWSGVTDRKAMYRWRAEARHRRIVSQFLDRWTTALCGWDRLGRSQYLPD